MMGRNHFRKFKLIIWGALLLAALVFFGAADVAPVYADPPPPDGACVGCHQDNQRTLTLPSGEELSLLALPEELAASPHTPSGEQPVSCSNCHLGPTRYRYPHPATPAHSLEEYTALAAQNCQECHNPHNPLHQNAEDDQPLVDAAAAELPNCIDCHGSHAVAPVAQIAKTMAPNCLTCHTDKESNWAENLIAPRTGLGAGADGYVGSRRCLGCHTDNYLGWRDTLHARTIHDVGLNPETVLADFDQPGVQLPFGMEEVKYVIGEKWQQRFITETVAGDLLVLPGQWNIATQEWVVDQRAEGETLNWRTECSFCHVTGLETAAWEFQEFGIGCEDCHGPGEAHADNPQEMAVFNQADDQVCGACHSRGTAPEGHPFPASYRPGDTLTDHFTFTADETTRWPNGSAKIHNQQYTDWMLSNKMQGPDGLRCVTCHAVHGKGEGPSQTLLPTNEMCSGCHAEKTTLARHIPYHQQAITKRDFTCNNCHMPLMATSAVAYDIHNHTFQQPNPQGTLDHGGLELMPNACNQCHTKQAETAEWAVKTINWAVENYSIVRTEYIFAPGPTPTSPPVPTPLPSVGERHEVKAYVDFAWVRPIFFSGLGLVGLVVLLLIVRSLWSRRASDAR
ncbi:MAG: hypothetical protein HY328_07930 [Chloroflexi bacterium]|nr:hypothetical protein [Chloroflexota bacterium]